MPESIYTSILEDVTKADSILETNDRVYRTDDAAIYNGFRNTTDTYVIKSKDAEKWLLPSESFLRVEFQLTNEAEDDIYADPVDSAAEHKGLATLIAGGLHLFDRARLVVDNNQVELVNKPGFVHLVDHLLSSTIDQINGVADNEWMWLDDGGVVTGVYTNGDSAGPASEFINSFAAGAGIPTSVHECYGYADPRKYLPIDNAGEGTGGPNPKYNHGFAMRWHKTRSPKNGGGAVVELAIPITRLFGFFADIRNAYKGMDFEIELVKNTNYAEIIHGTGARAYALPEAVAGTPPRINGDAADIAHVLIKNIEWIVPTLIPSTTALSKLQTDLASGHVAKKTFLSTQVYIQDRVPAVGANPVTSLADVDWRIQTTGKRISRVVVGFQHESQYRKVDLIGGQNDLDDARPTNDTNLTDYPHNGGIFSHLTNISRLELRFGSITLPRERYIDMEFREDATHIPNIARNYADFLHAGGHWNNDTSCPVTYEKFREMYPLFAFDLSRTSIDTDQTTSQDLRLVASVTPYVPRGTPAVGLGVQQPGYRVIAMVTYEYDVEFTGIDGRIAIKLP